MKRKPSIGDKVTIKKQTNGIITHHLKPYSTGGNNRYRNGYGSEHLDRGRRH